MMIRISTILPLVVSMLLGAVPLSAYADKEASIMIIDPPVATVAILSIAVRGLDWGPYSERRDPQVWLIDPSSDVLYQLTVAKNYRDCSLALAVKNECSDDQLFLRLEIPDDVKKALEPKMYGLYIVTENNISALGQFTIVKNPLSKTITEPTLVIEPVKGPIGTYVMLFGAGFPKEGLNVRFDRVKISVGGYLTPNDDGTFENVGVTIPATLTRDNKTIAITPGEHTIDVANDNPTNPRSASARFVVQDTIESGVSDKKLSKKEQDQIDKDRKNQEQIDKEQKKLEEEQKRLEKEKEQLEKEKAELAKHLEEQKKKEQQEQDRKKKAKLKREQRILERKLNEKERLKKEQEKKLSTIDKKQDLLDKKEDSLKTQFCDSELPLTFQPGCIPLKKEPVRSPYEGRPCSADMPITFQPGCVGQIPQVQRSLFAGKACSSDIPLVWQEGCIQQSPRVPEVQSFVGKKCNPLIPHYSQVGCIE